MSQVRVNEIVDANGGSNVVLRGAAAPVGGMNFRNRIINGDMRIDQRNNGASVAPPGNATTYTLDRWAFFVSQASRLTTQQNAGSVTPPAGFTNYLGVTSSSAYSVLAGDAFLLEQKIEGFNTADLGWGTANAQTVTLSFWVRSSLTGTFGGTVVNSTLARSYVFAYTVNAANTWEQKTVTIPGDTSGTWPTTNGIGLLLRFGLGIGSNFTTTAGSWQAGNFVSPTGAVSVVGTNGATFYITGVQLEAGSVATPFERRPYGTELALCQRYFYSTMFLRNANSFTAPTTNGVELLAARHQVADVTGLRGQLYPHPVPMRVTPTMVFYNPNNGGASGQVHLLANNGATQNYTGGFNATEIYVLAFMYLGVSVGTSGLSVIVTVHWSCSSEL